MMVLQAADGRRQGLDLGLQRLVVGARLAQLVGEVWLGFWEGVVVWWVG